MIRRVRCVLWRFGRSVTADRTSSIGGGHRRGGSEGERRCVINATTLARHVSVSATIAAAKMVDKEELRKRLTPVQYQVTQEKGTERPFTGCYNKTYNKGTYVCICCEQPLFSSDTKYDSGCGWPAFNDVLDQGKVKLSPDTSGGRIRTEVTCSKCDAHLGHVFGDGPKPTGKRFCINSASINFIPNDEEERAS